MVTLNLTILVELGLFLVFMWLMGTFVFKPLLEVMDRRAAKIEEDKATAQRDTETSGRLEAEYMRKVSSIHRDASHQVVRAHRKAQEEHMTCVAGLKREEEQEVLSARGEAQRAVEAERAHLPELAASLAKDMTAQLGLKREAT